MEARDGSLDLRVRQQISAIDLSLCARRRFRLPGGRFLTFRFGVMNIPQVFDHTGLFLFLEKPGGRFAPRDQPILVNINNSPH
jgi:hypothetical protein